MSPHPTSLARGVVQVQRQPIDMFRNPVGPAVTVAYMVCDPVDEHHQWWMSIEPLPILPQPAVGGSGSTVLTSNDEDGQWCHGSACLEDHISKAHANWLFLNRGFVRWYEIIEPSAPTTWPGGQ